MVFIQFTKGGLYCVSSINYPWVTRCGHKVKAWEWDRVTKSIPKQNRICVGCKKRE